MDYKEALKQVKAARKPEVYLQVSFDYNTTLILPHKEGIELINALSVAERFKDRYDSTPILQQMDKDSLTAQMVSQQEYQRIKLAQLLKVSLRDIQDMEKENSNA